MAKSIEMTVNICSSCSVVVAYGECSHLPDGDHDRIMTSAADLEMPALMGPAGEDGYFQCWVCGDDCLAGNQFSATIPD